MTEHFSAVSSPHQAPRSVEELTQNNIQTIIQLERKTDQDRSRGEAIIGQITSFFGHLMVVYVHLAWFVLWMAFNMLAPKHLHFDPYPFNFLTFTLSLEAIFLSIFILISQNRQAQTDERRNHLELQINLLAEQENTKILWMLERVAKHVGADISGDPDVRILEEATRPERLLDQIDQTLQQTQKSNGA